MSPTVSKAFLRSVGIYSKPKKKNKKNNRVLRAKLLEDDPYCYYCGCRLTLDDSTLDHAMPRSKGGTDDFDNTVLACWPCNQGKGDKIIIVWGR